MDNQDTNNQRIPKTIHYIWLGTRKLDKLSEKCINTWKKILPDYEIVRWDDEKCLELINQNEYARQAYEAKKYAFVSDYLRLYVLYNYGGVYMDTDVQVIKSIDSFLTENAFTCFENKSHIPTALLASEKNNIWIGMLLKDYDNRKFIDSSGNMDLTTNVDRITKLSFDWGFVPNGEEQILKSGVHIYTKDYFCPLDTLASKNDVITDNTYAIHLYNGSWRSPVRRKLSAIKKKLGINPDKLFGKKVSKLLRKL